MFRIGDGAKYKYVQIGDKKLVDLYLPIFANSDFTGSGTGEVLKLPDLIKPNEAMSGLATAFWRWTYLGDSLGFEALRDDVSTKIKKDEGFVIQATYVTD